MESDRPSTPGKDLNVFDPSSDTGDPLHAKLNSAADKRISESLWGQCTNSSNPPMYIIKRPDWLKKGPFLNSTLGPQEFTAYCGSTSSATNAEVQDPVDPTAKTRPGRDALLPPEPDDTQTTEPKAEDPIARGFIGSGVSPTANTVWEINGLPELPSGREKSSDSRPTMEVRSSELIEEEKSRASLRLAIQERAKAIMGEIETLIVQYPDDTVSTELIRYYQELADLLIKDKEKGLCCFSSEEMKRMEEITASYNKKVADVIASIVKDIQALETVIAVRKDQEIEERRTKLRKRSQEEGLTQVHFAPGEDPLNMEIPIIFKIPTISLIRPGSRINTKIPLITSKATFGSHITCTVELTPQKTDKRGKRVAPFMAEITYSQNKAGEPIFKLRMLHQNVTLNAGATSPASEIIELTPGDRVDIGGYHIDIEKGMHGYSFAAIHEMLFEEPTDEELKNGAKKGAVIELFEILRNQEVTTSEQDEEAHANLLGILDTILRSNIPEYDKLEVAKFFRSNYENIIIALVRELTSSGNEGVPSQDSGHFQTLQLLASIVEIRNLNYGISAEEMEAIYSHKDDRGNLLIAESLKRAKDYIVAAKNVTGSIPPNYLRRIFDRQQSQKEIEEHEKNRQIAEVGMVEIARFVSMRFMDIKDLQEMGLPSDYIKRVESIIEIRDLFDAMSNENTISFNQIFKLYALCKGKTMGGIFAHEEIHTRNSRIEVKVAAGSQAQEYVRNVAVFAARIAFKQLNELELNEKTTIRYARLIQGLVEEDLLAWDKLRGSETEIVLLPQDEEEQGDPVISAIRRIVADKGSEATAKLQIKSQAAQTRRDTMTTFVKAYQVLQEVKSADNLPVTMELLKSMLPFSCQLEKPGVRELIKSGELNIQVDKQSVDKHGIAVTSAATSVNIEEFMDEWKVTFNKLISGLRTKIEMGSAGVVELLPILLQLEEDGFCTFTDTIRDLMLTEAYIGELLDSNESLDDVRYLSAAIDGDDLHKKAFKDAQVEISLSKVNDIWRIVQDIQNGVNVDRAVIKRARKTLKALKKRGGEIVAKKISELDLEKSL